MNFELNNSRAGSGRALITVIIGVAIAIVGLWGSYVYGRGFSWMLNATGTPESPYTGASLAFAGLWMAAAVFLAIAGISLIVSGLARRRSNLVPGPTLYLLGLSVTGIGLWFVVHGQLLYGGGLTAAGLIIAWWEWTFDIS